MKQTILTLIAVMLTALAGKATENPTAAAAASDSVTVINIAVDSVAVDPVIIERTTPEDILDDALERVIVGNDTVSIIMPKHNFGRYDRGLYNYLFIPRGQWSFGLTAAYGEFNADDVQVLSLLKDFDFNGKIYSISPSVSYFIKNNQSVGMRFNYQRAEAAIGSLAIDIDDDMNFAIKDVKYYSNSYGLSAFYRNYVGLSSLKRFGIFNEVDLSFANGSSRFQRLYNDVPRDTRTVTTEAALNFSPGVTMFIMDYVSFNVSFGIFGIHFTKESQTTDGEPSGDRFSSGANFKFNLFNIKFGVAVSI